MSMSVQLQQNCSNFNTAIILYCNVCTYYLIKTVYNIYYKEFVHRRKKEQNKNSWKWDPHSVLNFQKLQQKQCLNSVWRLTPGRTFKLSFFSFFSILNIKHSCISISEIQKQSSKQTLRDTARSTEIIKHPKPVNRIVHW